MDATIAALRRIRDAYMRNVGEPAAQLVGGGVRGYLGLDAPEYANGLGMEAYRNAAAISNTPVVGMPSMAVRAGAKAAPAMARVLREQAQGFQEYNRALGPASASQAIVWHGSPHKFDRFDASKIGTGEGAQAYGHGLYLAESPGVAESYRKALSDNVFTVGGKDISGPTSKYGQPAQNPARAGLSVPEKMATYALDSAIKAGSSDPAADAIKHLTKYGKGIPDAASAIEVVRQWSQQGGKVEAGNLYKVDLPDEKIARMLDWDKPLSKQPEAVAELATVFGLSPQTTGAQTYDALTKKFGTGVRETLDKAGQSSAASVLRQRGIPGIRYLDQGSRGAGQGTSNFVVFPGEEAALTILERNNEVINALRKRKTD